MIIGFDIDGVVVDFDRHFVETIEEETGIKTPYPPKEFIVSLPGVSRDKWLKLIKYVVDTAYTCGPIEGAFEAIEKIYKLTGEKVLFVTARDPIIEKETLESFNKFIGDSFPYEIRFTNFQPKSTFLNDDIKYFVEDTKNQICEMSHKLERGFLIKNTWENYYNIPLNITLINNLEDVFQFLKHTGV